MIFDVNFKIPAKVGEIVDPKVYYEQHHGSNLVFSVIDNDRNLVARGIGINWNQTRQMTANPEWGKPRVIEIVEGALLAGQLSFQSMFFMHLNDNLPTTADYTNNSYLTCIVQVASHVKPAAKGLILDVFEGVKIQGQSGNWNSNSNYLRNGTMIFLERKTGLQYANANGLMNAAADGSRAAYPANVEA